MPTLIAGNESLFYYHHQGEPARPPLVLLHGAGGNYMHWPGELRRLPGQEVYALDLPGHGRSGGHGRTTIAEYAEAVLGFVAALDLPSFVLGGHSMGGAIALEFALRYPQGLAGLILAGTGARLRVAPQILDGILTDFDSTTALVTQWAHGPGTSARELTAYARRLRQVPPQVIHDDYAACNAFDRRAEVSRIETPALVICGIEDRMTPPKFSEWLAQQLPHAQLLLVPGAGHMLMLEPPRIIAVAAIAQYLEGLTEERTQRRRDAKEQVDRGYE